MDSQSARLWRWYRHLILVEPPSDLPALGAGFDVGELDAGDPEI
jgi:hypothetical protein